MRESSLRQGSSVFSFRQLREMLVVHWELRSTPIVFILAIRIATCLIIHSGVHRSMVGNLRESLEKMGSPSINAMTRLLSSRLQTTLPTIASWAGWKEHWSLDHEHLDIAVFSLRLTLQ